MEKSEHEKVLNAKHCRDYYWRNREAILAAMKAARTVEGAVPKKVGRPRTREDPPENLRRGRPMKIQKLQEASQNLQEAS